MQICHKRAVLSFKTFNILALNNCCASDPGEKDLWLFKVRRQLSNLFIRAVERTMYQFKSQRNGDVLSLHGFEYIKRKDRGSEGVNVWRCRHHHKFKCASTLSMGLDGMVIKGPTDHCHYGDPLVTKKKMKWFRT